MKLLSNWLLGEKNLLALKESDIKNRYANPLPSFPDRLAIVDFNEQEQVFLFADGKSFGSGFELGDIPAEAAAPEYLQAVFNKIRDTFASVVPLHAVDPWVFFRCLSKMNIASTLLLTISETIFQRHLKTVH